MFFLEFCVFLKIAGKMGQSPGIVQKNGVQYHKFEYPHFTYLTIYNYIQRLKSFSSFVREMKERLAWTMFSMLKLRY